MAFLIYGVVCYLLFFVTFLYLIGFVGNLAVPKSIDSGPAGPVGWAVFVNVLLIALFGLQHSTMARPGFKAWWTRYVPKPIERSTYVLITSIIFLFMFWQWQPIPTVVWQVDNPIAAGALRVLFAFGWGLALLASFLIDHFDLFGVRQVVLHWRNQPYTHPPFAMPWLYRLVRNPLMLGFVIAVWSTPVMTLGHLLFSATMTGYVLIGIHFEERDLMKVLGEPYLRYREATPMLLPWPKGLFGGRKAPSAQGAPDPS